MLTYNEFLEEKSGNNLTEAIVKGKGKPKYTPGRASKTSFSIGDLVHLDSPIDGYEFGQISGFVIDKAKIKNAGAPLAPLAGSKVASIMVKLKKSPFAVSDFGRTVEVDKATLKNISGRGEELAAYDAWRKLGLA